MSDSRSVGGVTYTQAGSEYFQKRQLTRAAGFWGLWGLGVAAVVSGDFSGWNFGLGAAGWGGLLIATLIIIVMYFGMLFSIGEMSAALPHTGGAYSFARSAMGPWGGFVTGFAETIEYVFTTGVIVLFSADYLNGIFSILTGGAFDLKAAGLQWVWWIVLYAVFIGLNTAGAAISFRFAVVVSILTIGILVLFGVLAFANGAVDFSRVWDIAPDESVAGSSEFLPFGGMGILFALPFAMWFFLGIEELPLAAEEAHNPQKDIPRAGIWGLLTLIFTGAIVLFLNPAVTGSAAIAASGEPLLDGFRAFLPPQLAAVLALFALIGLLASLQGIMFAYGRNMYSLSRAGYYPKFLSLTGKRQTPWVALLTGAIIGFVVLVGVDLITKANEDIGAVSNAIVLNIAVWGAVISYLLQMVSYIVLKVKLPNVARPYRSPVGIAGAAIAGVIALATFIGQFINPGYTAAIIAIGVLYVIGLVIFALVGRHRLVLSPEEEYALSGGQHRDPQAEGYDAMEKEVFDNKP
ncbi:MULTISPECIES: amino acid permease [Microbacterium]|uniref:amino acid permease n=1 Tax=Microbacterium TaxID=33882 RepID=UPI0028648664|nr:MULTISPECIES: amino acid permease [Microbacterium]MDR7110952.1 ethanolamine permease [Microbacterium trichothecenolyticum]MDT0144657.1 amino acid permease [Microbacterium sp. PRC9]